MSRPAAWLLLLGLAVQSCLAGDAPGGKVLFICTGNFFRSAFAEQYFNYLAAQNRKLDPKNPLRKKGLWVAESRGLDIAQLAPSQRAAKMSVFAVERLKKLKIPLAMGPGGLPVHTPTLLTVQDLERCDRVIAMHDPTHRPMLRRFMESRKDQTRDPKALLDRVVYWNIADVIPSPAIPATPAQQADRALDAVQKEVDALFAGL